MYERALVVQARSYAEVILATHPADRVEVMDLPEGAVYATVWQMFPAEAIEIADYQDKLAHHAEKKSRGGGSRTEFNKHPVCDRIKAAQKALLRDHSITNGHIADQEQTSSSWNRLNRNPASLHDDSYRSIWSMASKRGFAAILRAVPRQAIQMPFAFHRFSRTCKEVETVLVTAVAAQASTESTTTLH